jgi:hypothetical protein
MTLGFFSHYFSQKQKLESNSLFPGGPHHRKEKKVKKKKKHSKAIPSLLFNFLSSVLLSFPFLYGLPSNNLPRQFSRSPFLSLLFPFPPLYSLFRQHSQPETSALPPPIFLTRLPPRPITTSPRFFSHQRTLPQKRLETTATDSHE